MTASDFPISSGWCRKCQTQHQLGPEAAITSARELMAELANTQRIDYLTGNSTADPQFSTAYLESEALGQMFGVLAGEDAQGRIVVLRAFSCQYNAHWQVEGWAPPLFDVAEYERIMVPGDRRIKALGRDIEDGRGDVIRLKQERRLLSRSLMKQLHDLYEVVGFSGETRPLASFFEHTNGIPTGAGDCCAPKLLNQAIRQNLRPLGLAEFYWGRTNRSGTRQQGHFYGSCADKCQPMLGFMLCGAAHE